MTNIGNTSDKIIISDNATPGSATWALYLNPEKVEGPKYQNVHLLEEIAGPDNLVEDWGGIRLGYTFRNCKKAISGSGGFLELMKRAFQYWSVESKKLYLWVKDKNGYNTATWGNDAGSAVVQIQCVINTYVQHDEDSETNIFDISVIKAV